MPSPLAPFVAFGLGALLAFFVRARAPLPKGRLVSDELVAVALFAALVVAPVVAYFTVLAPDWALLYLIDSARVPSAVDLVAIVVDAALVPAGFVLARRELARGRLRAALALGVGPLAFAIVVALAFAHELSIDGTYRQVHAGFGVKAVAGGPLGFALIWMLAMLGAGFAIAARGLSVAGAKIERSASGGSRDTPPAEAPRLLGRAGGRRR